MVKYKKYNNKVFWASVIHPFDFPLAHRPKQKNFVLHLIRKATQETIYGRKR
jgi:hypothetical protein